MAVAKQDLPRVTGRGRALLLAAAAVVVFGVVIARWMVSPFDDWVPLVVPRDLPAEVSRDDLPVSAHFRCSAAFGETESAAPSEQATDALALQDLSREPCSESWAQHRVLGPLNLALAAGLLVGLAAASRRRAGGDAPDAGPAPTA